MVILNQDALKQSELDIAIIDKDLHNMQVLMKVYIQIDIDKKKALALKQQDDIENANAAKKTEQEATIVQKD